MRKCIYLICLGPSKRIRVDRDKQEFKFVTCFISVLIRVRFLGSFDKKNEKPMTVVLCT